MQGLLDALKKGFSSENMQGLQSNPMFNMGMGLLSSSYDGNINPYQAAMKGLLSANQQSKADEKQKALEGLLTRMGVTPPQNTPQGMAAAPEGQNMNMATPERLAELGINRYESPYTSRMFQYIMEGR